jgi:thioredoxin 1
MDWTELSNETLLSALKAEPLAFVDIYATWCGSCRLAAPMFKRVAEEMGMKPFKIEAEKNESIHNLVTVANLPTIAVFKNGVCLGSLCTTKEESLREFLLSVIK